MKKTLLLLTAFVCLGGAVVAQNDDDDYKKREFFVGYSNGQADGSLNGFNVSATYNVMRYFGLKGDLSTTVNSRRVTTFAFSNNGTPYTESHKSERLLFNALGGLQLKDNARTGRLKPFAHALIGAGYERNKVSDFQCTPAPNCPGMYETTFGKSGVAAAVGGGLDVRIKNRFQIRAIQVDYNPVRYKYGTDNNTRLGAGIVF